jgi:hypothetical protein
VPTIGGIYERAPGVLYYYSGLGRPFLLKNLDSPRHWINRAWTVQETTATKKQIICGVVADSPPENDHGDKFYSSRDQFTKSNGSILGLLRGLLPRHASHEQDKIASLAHLVVTESNLYPISLAHENLEVAWTRLWRCMDCRIQMQLIALDQEIREIQRFPILNPAV